MIHVVMLILCTVDYQYCHVDLLRCWSITIYKLNQFNILFHFHDKDRDRDPRRWGRRGLYLTLHCHHQNDIALRWAAMWVILMFHLLWRAKSQYIVHITTTSERGTLVFSLIRKAGSLHKFCLWDVVAKDRFETVTHPIGDHARSVAYCVDLVHFGSLAILSFTTCTLLSIL